jgi:serine protease Do
MGSGIVMSEDDSAYYILTNAHVVDGADDIVLYYYEEEESVPAQLVGEDTQSDIAVLKIAKADIPATLRSQVKVATFGDSDNLRIGQTAIVIGSPEGVEFSNSTTVGVISGTQRQVEVDGVTMNYLQTDAAINPGNSGGALLNTDGEVIGVTSAKIASDDVEGIGFAIPINTALEVANELMENGYVEWLSLGLEEYDFLEQAIADAYHVPTGIVVYQTVKGGPAAQAGLQRGDLITAINGVALETATDLQTILGSYQAGDTVTLTVIRNRDTDNPLTVRVVLMTESEIEALQETPNFWGNNQ